jgi:putative SOS response-associated peptidase YedK
MAVRRPAVKAKVGLHANIRMAHGYHPRMSTHYESLSQADAYRDAFDVEPPAASERNMTPRKPGFFIRSAALPADAAAVAAAAQAESAAPTPSAPPLRELVPAQWGLVPHWVKSASDGRLRALKLVNARSETVSTAQAFRDAWLRGQRCIVPMAAFSEDDLRSGKAVPTRISRIDGKPMGVAGLWAQWSGPDGEVLLSYTLLTVNANSHALLHRYQQPGAEKRMPAVLNEGAYDAWLNARVEKAREFMRQYPANWLTANPVERKADKRPPGLMG